MVMDSSTPLTLACSRSAIESLEKGEHVQS